MPTYGREHWKIDGPIQIGDRSFAISELNVTIVDARGQGNQLWPCSIALAQLLEEEPLGESLCDCGCGLGLVGISVAHRCKVTLLDQHEATAKMAQYNAAANGCDVEVLQLPFLAVSQPFDSMVGSEVIYGAFDLPDLAAMIARCWTGRGACLFVASTADSDAQWQSALASNGLKVESCPLRCPLPGGYTLPCFLWDVRR